MDITAEEKLMYTVMKALCDSGIPISFKGSMVLKACLLEAGYAKDIRHTVDIDANWYSAAEPTAEQMIDSLKSALKKSGIRLNVSLIRMYGRNRSAGFALTDPDTRDLLFTMDLDVNRPVQPTQLYVIDEFTFRGISPSQMLADKVSVVSSEKVFRRIKDVVDLYYLSHVIAFDQAAVTQALANSGKIQGDFSGFLHRVDDLKHAYEKFRFAGGVNKPPFDELYQKVKAYIHKMLPNENRGNDDRAP